jgi:hypothetical protein
MRIELKFRSQLIENSMYDDHHAYGADDGEGTVQGCVVLIMQGGPIRDDRV